jgi:hypothetical protein
MLNEVLSADKYLASIYNAIFKNRMIDGMSGRKM